MTNSLCIKGKSQSTININTINTKKCDSLCNISFLQTSNCMTNKS